MVKRRLAMAALTVLAVISVSSFPVAAAKPQPASSPLSASEQRALLDRYCVSCHNAKLKTAGLALDTMDLARVSDDAEVWEKVIRKLRGGLMPPAGRPRPDRVTYDALRTSLEGQIDRVAAANLNPGRPAAFHRLNRTEYRNAVRDLLALDVDVSAWLPGDPSSYGFDNIGDALGISSGLLEQYLASAQRISRLALGNIEGTENLVTYVVPSDFTQRDRIDGLPFGTRGGMLIHHNFPVDAQYTIQLRLGRNYNTRINGLAEPHQIEVTIDGERVELFTVGGGGRRSRGGGGGGNLGGPVIEDDPLKLRLPIKAGPRAIGVAFVKHSSAEYEDLRRPILRDRVEYSDTQGQPTLSRIEIAGPFDGTGINQTPSRQRVLICRPTGVAATDTACAKKTVAAVAHRAYRRPVTTADLDLLMSFYTQGEAIGGFERGIEEALARILVSPSFLFRIERDPPASTTSASYRVSDVELASRLSFFLWSSIPDDELLDLAEHGRLKEPAVFDAQVRRMLADSRSEALITDFIGQWLQLRNVSNLKPDRWLFPDFDENLRVAFRRETELFVNSILRENRSVLDLLTANYTFLNERLARHYGIPNVYGDHFRRVTFTDDQRGGLLGQASILTLTSSANRTSPVKRGVYILENILGVAPPAPPPNVPPLVEAKTGDGKVLSMRERMVAHRANPICASCHGLMDPLGLPLESFDAVGRSRTTTESKGALDVSGVLPDGTAFEGIAGLKKVLMDRSDAFVTTVTEKMLTYALGRGLEYYDAPTVRGIVHNASSDQYRLSDLILGVVKSNAFQMKRGVLPS